MLTDIFSNRYADVILWENFEERDGRFLVQAFRIISEQLYPYWIHGKEDPQAKAQWQAIHDKLSMELGLEELSPRTYSWTPAWPKDAAPQVSFYTLDRLCRNFVLVPYDGSVSADRFMKERLSFFEIAFRHRAEELETRAAKFKSSIDRFLIGQHKLDLRNSADELNARMRQVGYELHYHNGFIQRSVDPVVEDQIEQPFWDLVADARWQNVDLDMKEAIDRRDNGDRNPAFYAARALESIIKIVSDMNGWTHGGEKGAHNYIDNLGSPRAGQFITDWEVGELKNFFTHVRNPLGQAWV